MTTVLFVHGTGTRSADSQATLEKIKKALKPLADVVVDHCDWGDDFGTKLFGKGASIPKYVTARGLGARDDEADDDEHVVALWTLLASDPLFELRLLAQRPSGAEERAPGQAPPGKALEDELGMIVSLDALPPEKKGLAEAVTSAGLAPWFEQACADILGETTLTDAIEKAPAELNADRAAVGRAVIAQALLLAESESDDTAAPAPAAANDAELRDAAAAAVAAAMGPSSRTLVGRWVRAPFIAVGKRMATRYLRRKRGKVTDEVFGFPGDVLLYQTRGRKIRRRIADKVKAVKQADPKGKVVLLAHSLGGIASVDLLIACNPGVDRLITVGSQAPYLYEMNALSSLPFKDVPPDQRLPAYFPGWVNVYDPRDMLSYLAHPLFGTRAEDIPVDNGKPFPNSHTAYWDNKTFWAAIGPKLP
jgi:hypothetical protein